jgi:DMSO/TMAO reductase YedYZ molybdopterin-dependent catalytic subunit
VPGWYAVAAVKWLTEIEVVEAPFTGHYQTEKYCYEWTRAGEMVREPVTLQQVRALITERAARKCRAVRRLSAASPGRAPPPLSASTSG